MSGIFGIDLGTTNSVIAQLKDGRPQAISLGGSALVPSVVRYLDDAVVVGREARNLALVETATTVRSVKRRMGEAHVWRIGGRDVTPEQASAEILRALAQGAQAATGEVVRDVVITVPAYFDDAQRRATLRAGELAGLHVLRLVNEPTAASLVYDAGAQSDAPEHVLVYDLGGGTFDVSVLEVFEGVREVRATAGDSRLGGDDFDALLADLFATDLRDACGFDAQSEARALAILSRVAEETKIALSTETEVHVQHAFVGTHRGSAVNLDIVITRHDFELLIARHIERTIDLTSKVLGEAELSPSDISRLCLVGGSSRIPLVRRLLDEAFGLEVHEEIDPDLAVALGAAVQAGILAGSPVDRVLVDVASHDLGIRVLRYLDYDYEDNDAFAPIVRRNVALPARRSEEFVTLRDNQKVLDVEVYQGNEPSCSRNRLIGSYQFKLMPAPIHCPLSVELAYDLDGIVKVTVSQRGYDNTRVFTLSVSDASEVARAGSAAVERRAEALAKRLKAKPRKRLEGLLEALRAAPPEKRQAAEDLLLDFLILHEDEPE